MHKNTIFHFLIGGLALSPIAYAAARPNLIVTLSMGPTWVTAPKRQTLPIMSTLEKTYTQNSVHNVLSNNELFLGVQYPVRDIWLNQIGAAIVANSYAKITGDVWDEAQPEFNNHVYRYRVQHTHVAIKEKLLLNKNWYVKPWVNASIGVALNRSGRFKNTPIISEAVATPNFSLNSQVTFTYTLGFGVQRMITNHWQAGLGYEFADWGKHYLGRSDEQTLGRGPGANHLYTNSLLFNLTYIN